MSLPELLPILRELDRADKLRALQFLAIELAREENALLANGEDYPIWSPYHSFEAADILLNALKAEDKHA